MRKDACNPLKHRFPPSENEKREIYKITLPDNLLLAYFPPERNDRFACLSIVLTDNKLTGNQ